MSKQLDYYTRMKQERISKLKKDYAATKKDYINAKIAGLNDSVAWETMQIIVEEIKKLGGKL